MIKIAGKFINPSHIFIMDGDIVNTPYYSGLLKLYQPRIRVVSHSGTVEYIPLVEHRGVPAYEAEKLLSDTLAAIEKKHFSIE